MGDFDREDPWIRRVDVGLVAGLLELNEGVNERSDLAPELCPDVTYALAGIGRGVV